MQKILILLIVISAISCKQNKEIPLNKEILLKKEGDLIFTYGCGKNKNQLNTITEKFQKDMVINPPVTFKLKLSASQLDTIISKAKEIALENYPENFVFNDTDTLVSQTPCSTYSIMIYLNGKIKAVSWDDCRYKLRDEKYEHLKGLVGVIITMIQDTPEYKASPHPKGAYL